MRDLLDLSGAWHWSIDPYRDGVAGFHGDPAGYGHRRWEDVDVAQVERANPNALFEYDMARSPTANLPSSWITQDPTLRHYDGLVWYQRSFAAAHRPGKRAFLRFGAVEYSALVFLNGRELGHHEALHSPSPSRSPACSATATMSSPSAPIPPIPRTRCRRRSQTGRPMAASPARSPWSIRPPPMSTTPG
jgi:hypothetical protein